MIGIGVYRFASNDYSLTPFHYFFDLNSWLVTGLFAERPLPVYIIIQIQLIIGLSLFGMVGGQLVARIERKIGFDTNADIRKSKMEFI